MTIYNFDEKIIGGICKARDIKKYGLLKATEIYEDENNTN